MIVLKSGVEASLNGRQLVPKLRENQQSFLSKSMVLLLLELGSGAVSSHELGYGTLAKLVGHGADCGCERYHKINIFQLKKSKFII